MFSDFNEGKVLCDISTKDYYYNTDNYVIE